MNTLSLQSFSTLAAAAALLLLQPTDAHAQRQIHAPATQSWQELLDVDAVHRSTSLDTITMPDGKKVDLDLQPIDVMSDDGVIIIESEFGQRFYQAGDLVHLYRGQVAGDDSSAVYLAATNKQLNGFIQMDDEVYMVSTGPFTGRKPNTLHVSAPWELEAWMAKGPFCGVDHMQQPALELGQAHNGAANAASRNTCTIIELAMDSDWEYTEDVFDGDAEESAAYAITLAGAISEIYTNEVEFQLALNYIRTWADDSDPYDPNGIDMLDQFHNHWSSQMGGVDRDVAHILTGRDNLDYGGVAFLNGLCSYDLGYSVTADLTGSFPYPLEDNVDGNYDLIVMAHELGHNFGAWHTHDHGIDGCPFGDCTNADQGTIMSYCFQCPGYLTNIRLGFHEQIKNQMYAHINEQSCDEEDECVGDWLGACCTGGACDMVNELNCADGIWQGLGVSCADTECADIPGACCLGHDGCILAIQDECDGNWFGGGTSCDDGNVDCAATGTYSVPGDYSSIQAAINSVGEYSIINVGPGTYYEHVSLNGKNLQIIGVGGPEMTTIHGMNSGTVLTMMNGEDATTTIDGFGLTGGSYSSGAGIRCDANPNIMNCKIYGNYANAVIGGLLSIGETGPTIGNTHFCENYVNGFPDSHLWGEWIELDFVTFADDCSTPLPDQGACCMDGTACDVMAPMYCLDMGGDYQGNYVPCDAYTCALTGACCVDEQCSVEYEIDCEGEYLGDGEGCNGNPCYTPSPGACCVDEQCSLELEADCNGDFLGDGTDCTDNPCYVPPTGACCIGEACVPDSTEAQCSAVGGDWNEDEPCDESTCIEIPCDGDFNGDGTVSVNDLLTVIQGWGDPYGVDDLLVVIGAWGQSCP